MVRRHIFGLIAGFWLVACGREEQATSTSEHEPEAKPAVEQPDLPKYPPEGALVIISVDAQFHTSPNPSAAQFPMPDRTGVGVDRGFGRVMQVVGTQHGYLHVRTVEPELELCAPTIGIEHACELRMFVEPKFLRPVVIRPTQQLLDDGTRLALRPGTPVDGPGPEAIAHVLGAAITVALDEADVGRWYMPSAYTRPPADESLVYFGEALRYGEHTLSTFRWRSPTVTAERMIEGQRLLSFDNACGSFDLLVEEAEPAADDGPGRYAIEGPKDAIPQMAGKFDPDMAARHAGILGVLSQSVGDPTHAWAGCLPERWTVAAQTSLRWPDGGAAGLTRLEIKLDAEPEVTQEQACFPISTQIQVCADAAKVVHHERDDCPQLGPGAGTGGLTPQIQQGNATITGNLNGDIIRRIVRAHVNEVRSCYEQGLTNNPGLNGTVVISFEITTTGKVSSAKVDSTELMPHVDAVTSCITKAVNDWKFPRPRGGVVSVRCPFGLSLG